MKKNLLFILLSGFFLIARSQPPTFQWAKGMGGMGDDAGRSVATDVSGNVIVAGYFTGTADFDPGPGTNTLTSLGAQDIFISKMDAAGNLLWVQQIGGAGSDEALSVTVDKNGDVFITGYFQNVVDFDPGVSTFTMATNGSSDMFISKITTQGGFVWAKQFSGTASGMSTSIKVDAAGDVYTAGYFKGTVDFDPGVATFTLNSGADFDAFVSKLSATGSFVYIKRFDGIDPAFANSLDIGPNGDVFVTGGFTGSVDFDPGAPVFMLSTSQTLQDIFVARFNSTGNFIWATAMGGTGNDFARCIHADKNNELHITGEFNGTADLDPTNNTFNVTSIGQSDIFVIRMQASGAFLWAAGMGGSSNDSGSAIAADSSGNTYFTGTFSNTVDFDPGAGNFSLTTSGYEDVFVCKLTSSGTLGWAVQMGGNGIDKSYGMAVDGAVNVHTTGWFESVADFDPGQGTFTLNPAGQRDIFVHKLGKCDFPAKPVNTTPPSLQLICDGMSSTLSAGGAGTISWFTGFVGGTAVATGTSMTTPTLSPGTYNYYVEAATCTTSASRAVITVTVEPVVTAVTNLSLICSGEKAVLTASGSASYSWNHGAGGASVVINPAATTSYTVTGTNLNPACNSAVVTQQVSECAGIITKEGNNADCRIYPNPFTDRVTIEFAEAALRTVEVFNASGALIYKTNGNGSSIQVDLTPYAPGIYLLRSAGVYKKLVKAD